MSEYATLTFIEHTALLVHRVLAQHGAHEFCEECPFVSCRHCGDLGRPDEDHTCPCPKSDADCTEHRPTSEGTD